MTGALDEGAARSPLALGPATTEEGVADGMDADADAVAVADVDAGIRALAVGCAAAEPAAVASVAALASSAGAGGLGGSQKIAK
jgi:hypothetical protein